MGQVMGMAQFLAHVGALLLPAWAVAALLVGMSRALLRRARWRMRFWVNLLAAGLLGSLVLLAGLLFSGEDGRMGSYAALLLALASLQAWAAGPQR
ncbi:hypothetical protein CLI92_01565 [Vandammella animalimorsus]|uniref:Uncharacterized protein n=2 Tax=Vandammella animalimorsus TaxID=2029117 RepID=A0A2A2T8S4_9BURK|nr:hypothetical protein CK626_00150 [Vandammella animalimorsus]PAX18535.1 hypothetical protein CLI92_01565 [Vandammella animalimorsus]PAX20697.1 hypothetical protein CLI93_02985 [Vandammella animalimorsus]